MEKLKTISIIVLALSLVVAMGLMLWQVKSLENRQEELIREIGVSEKSITKSLHRASSKTVENSEQLEQFAEENKLDINEVKEDIRRLGAKLEAVSSTIAETKSVVHIKQISDSTTQTKNEPVLCPDSGELIDQHEYTKAIQHRFIEDENKMRVADVSFDASSRTPWTDKVYGIRYIINSSLSRDRSNNLVLHSELLSENPEVQPGEFFRIETVQSNLLQVEQKPEFRLWDPAIYLSISAGINFWPQVQFSATMNLGVSVMSYGAWRFIGLNAGFDGANNTFQASFFPFTYNIAEHMPVVSNIYLFPYIGINHQNTVGAGIGLGVRL